MADNNLTTKEEFLLNPVEEHNITNAAVASFETNLKHPLKVTVPITPIQDLHGYDRPWPAGGSVNLIPDGTDISKGYLSGGYLNADGTTSAGGAWYVSEYFSVEPGESYTWSSSIPTIGAASTCFYDENKQYISGEAANAQLPKTLVAPENAVYCRTSQYLNNRQFCQIEKGSIASALVPYSNICPIEGWASSNINRCGKNILNPNASRSKGNFTADGNIGSAGSTYVFGIPVDSNATYTLYTAGAAQFRVGLTNAYPVVGVYCNYLATRSASNAPYVINTGAYKYIALATTASAATVANAMIIKGNNTTATFEEYRGTPIQIAFTDPSTGDPMTVYQGSLTLNEDGSADLVSERATYILDGVERKANGYQSSGESQGFAVSTQIARYVTTTTISTWSSHFCAETYQNRGNRGVNNAIYLASSNGSIRIRADEFGDEDSYIAIDNFNAYLADQYAAGTPVQVMYLLKSNAIKTYHFSNVGQLKAFLGTNNVWPDIGNVNVKYLTQNSATGLEYRGDRALELRRRSMMADAPTIRTTVGSEETGGLASFKGYVKAPVKKIEIPFSPKQDLHGQEYPYPAGGGKNIWGPKSGTNNGITFTPQSDGTVQISGTYASNGRAYVYGQENIPLADLGISVGDVVYIWCDPYGIFNGYDSNNVRLVQKSSAGESPVSVTIPDDCAYVRLYQYASISEGAAGDSVNTTGRFLLTKDSTVTEWTPYENICPIEGHDGVNIEQRRKNLILRSLTISDLYNTYPNNGTFVSSSNYRTFAVKIPKNVDITWRRSSGSLTGYVCLADDLPTIGTAYRGAKTTTNLASVVYTNNTAKYLCITIGKSNTDSDETLWNSLTTYEMSVNVGNDLNYYPATYGNTLPIIFNQSGDHAFLPIQEGIGDPSPENVRPIHQGLTFTRDDDSVLSVYGGTLTVNIDGTGSLSSGWFKTVINGNNAISAIDSNENRIAFRTSISSSSPLWPRVSSNSYTGAIANWSIESIQYCGHNPSSITIPNHFALSDSYRSYYHIGITIPPIENATEEDIITYLNANPLEICYPIDDTQITTYALSVTETNRALEALGLTDHIGPLYGGTITINPDGSADVVADAKCAPMSSSLISWSSAGASPIVQYGVIGMKSGNWNTSEFALCNKLKKISGSTEGVGIRFGANNNAVYFYNINELDESIETGLDVRNYLYNNNFVICFPLNTPQTYHFSNLEQLKTFLGENNFWCDISDDITVKYWNRG